jgi:hypothetical protein
MIGVRIPGIETRFASTFAKKTHDDDAIDASYDDSDVVDGDDSVDPTWDDDVDVARDEDTDLVTDDDTADPSSNE